MKKEKKQNLYSVRMRAGRGREHISGAEGIFGEKETGAAVLAYTERAMRHSKGRPDTLRLTVELVQKEPVLITALPVRTLRTKGPSDAKQKAARLLSLAGVSGKAAGKAFRILSAGGMRGAALLDRANGKRFDPDRKRGVRASMLGISKGTLRRLGMALSKKNIDHPRVKEALVLASKVGSAPGISAELCISDDPDYTTGYVASPSLGYIRLPRIKKKGSPEGGRVFFTSLRDSASTGDLISYLEKTPVIVGKISHIGDIITLHGLLKAHDHCKPRGEKILRKKD